MKIPLSWLKDYIDLNLPLDELAKVLTMIGLEVEDVAVVGLAMPEQSDHHEFKIEGLTWAPDKFVVAQIDEVMPHPNADRLVLCRLNDGTGELVVLTGAPNLFEYRGVGPLERPLKVAYAREGAVLYDGHQPGFVLTTLKRAKIRGVDSFSMVCSEKELGISEEHEGIIVLDDDAPTGMPLVDYMGDAVYEVSILPNMIRNASIMGVARELSAALDIPLRKPDDRVSATGASIEGQAAIDIQNPDLNPRFVLGLIRGVEQKPSPYWVQRRLRLAGMRPINSVVDATNYVMLETGEPLHAFDYDILKQRAGDKTPTIITRPANPGETLTTLDAVERKLEPYMVLVTDTAGPLSLAGIMGGLESEITSQTQNVLLEGASWNFVNIRKAATNLHLNSEAGYRFSRGVHPELAPWAVKRCLMRMAEWANGEIAKGLIDAYPAPVVDPVVKLTPAQVKRLLGIELSALEIANILTRLEFVCEVTGDTVTAKTPPHRLDIGEGVVGQADLIEEIARLYHYDHIPETSLADMLPPAHRNLKYERSEYLRDLLANLGLQEVINYRLTTPQRERRILPAGSNQADLPYIELKNPTSPERSYMRRNLLASVMETLEKNSRLRESLAFFELGPVFIPVDGEVLPEENFRLAIALTGKRSLPAWDLPDAGNLDFYDLKGIIEAVFQAFHIEGVEYICGDSPSYHPGKCATIRFGNLELGTFGELHPEVKGNYDLSAAPVLAADINASALISLVPEVFSVKPVPTFPPVLEDIAIIVDEDLPVGPVMGLIRQTGGKLLTDVALFDIYQGDQIGTGKKSLAFSLTYQADDHTLTAPETTALRNKIVRRLEHEIGAVLRG